MKYEDLLQIQPTDYRATYIYRGNSAFDPDYTSAGHQPRTFDFYAGMYGRYRVVSSKLYVDVMNHSGDSALAAVLTPHTERLTFTSWQVASELPLSRVSRSIPVASRLDRVLGCRVLTSTVTGLVGSEVLDEDWSAPVTADPVQLWYWNLNLESLDESSYVDAEVRISMTLDVIFYDRIDPGLSALRSHQKQEEVKKSKQENQKSGEKSGEIREQQQTIAEQHDTLSPHEDLARAVKRLSLVLSPFGQEQ